MDTGPEYYHDMTVEYHGVEADDLPTFELSQFFYSASKFIDNALQDERSKEGAENGWKQYLLHLIINIGPCHSTSWEWKKSNTV